MRREVLARKSNREVGFRWVRLSYDTPRLLEVAEMQWQEIRKRYPHQWLLLEAIDAHSSEGQRIVEDMAVLESYRDGMSAMNGYRELHHREPHRELYVLHTDRETLQITELGSRRSGRGIVSPRADFRAGAPPSRA